MRGSIARIGGCSEGSVLSLPPNSGIYSVSTEQPMNQHVKKWGNSAAVRIPAATLAAAGLKTDDAVDVREENGRIVIEKVRAKIDLDEMISRITPENRHDVVDWGPPVGKEVW